MRITARTILIVCGLVWSATGAATARGDGIRLKNGITYEPVQIVKVADGFVTFQFPVRAGRQIIKSLSEVAAVTIGTNADYNRAESLMGQGMHSQALDAFGAAENAARDEWEKTLISYRLLAAADAAAQIDQAVTRWLAIVDKADATDQSLQLCPKNPAPGRSPQNDRAIALLEAKAKQVTSEKFLRQIQRLLVDLYELQGRADQARALAAKLVATAPATGPAATGPTGERTTDPSSLPPRTPASNADTLRAAAVLLDEGRYGEAAAMLRHRLEGLSAVELPAGLLLLGKAQLEMAKSDPDPDKARRLLLESGLNLMRVAACFPKGQEAPEALLAAGEVNERLDNTDAARAAYALLLKRYAGSAVATQARHKLDRLGKARE